MPVKPIPDGYHSVTPYLIVKGAARAIDFYKKAFDAREIFRMEGPDGKVGHAEIQIGDSRVMLADEHPEVGAVAPAPGGHPVSFLLYVDDVDQWFPRALAAGAKQLRAVTDQFYGDRTGMLTDPFGHTWSIATHKEDLSPDELQRRAAAAHGKA
jgi:PhnB protein